MKIIQPGNGIVSAAITDGELIDTDSSLVDIDGGLIVDLVGNTISIGGGHDGGDAVVNATLTPVDDPTTVYTGADGPTAVTWG